jgi:hypothetical protein
MKYGGRFLLFNLKFLVMKKLLLSFGVIAVIAIVFVSCQGRTAQLNQVQQIDTTGFAQFQAFKAMQQQQAMMAAMTPAPQKEIVYVKQRAAAPAKQYAMNSESTNEAKVAKKKGWSKAAKYSVIGGVGGGVLGAVINKKDPVKGAVIGAVVLGGGGYILGRSQDKKDGRVQ